MKKLLALLPAAIFGVIVACSNPDTPNPAPPDGGVTGDSSTDGATSRDGSTSPDDAGVDRDTQAPAPKTCMQATDCTAPSACVFFTSGGVCTATCDPFGSDCPSGSTCTAHASELADASGTQTSHAAFCRTTGGTALGASCVSDPSSCGANADCHYFPDNGEVVGDSKCHSLCDSAHACGAGNCIILDGETFGFCDG